MHLIKVSKSCFKRSVNRLPKFTGVVLAILLLLYFTGYQPTLAIPPLRQAVAHAQTLSQQEQNINALTFGQAFNLPHPGYLTTAYSRWHPGIDIAAGLGMPVRPIAPGKVVEVSLGFLGLGHYVAVEHNQGIKSVYGHMGRIFVRAGSTVDQNSILGEVGLTGRTTGPHTHLEVTLNGQYLNPLTILPRL